MPLHFVVIGLAWPMGLTLFPLSIFDGEGEEVLANGSWGGLRPDMVQLWRICAVFFYLPFFPPGWCVLERELRLSLLLILFITLVPGNI